MNNELINLLPQKEPFLFVESVERLEKGKYSKTRINIRKDDAYFAGHFPDHPIMPGCLIIECIAQAAELLFINTDNNEVSNITNAYLVQVKNILFYKPVIPDIELMIEVEFIRSIGNMFEVSGYVHTEKERIAKGNLVLMINKK